MRPRADRRLRLDRKQMPSMSSGWSLLHSSHPPPPHHQGCCAAHVRGAKSNYVELSRGSGLKDERSRIKPPRQAYLYAAKANAGARPASISVASPMNGDGRPVTQLTRGIHQMSEWGCASVADAGTTWLQHWVNVSSFWSVGKDPDSSKPGDIARPLLPLSLLRAILVFHSLCFPSRRETHFLHKSDTDSDNPFGWSAGLPPYSLCGHLLWCSRKQCQTRTWSRFLPVARITGPSGQKILRAPRTHNTFFCSHHTLLTYL